MDRSRVDGKPLYVDVVLPCYVVILRESETGMWPVKYRHITLTL